MVEEEEGARGQGGEGATAATPRSGAMIASEEEGRH